MWWNCSWAVSNSRWFCESAALGMLVNLESSAGATGLEKVSFHSNPPKCSNYHTIALISHACKVMLKILQLRLQQYMNQEFPHIQAVLRKGRGTRIKLPRSTRSSKKQESSRRNTYFCFIDYAKALTVWITINCGKFWKRWEYQTTWPASWETCMQVRKQQLELDKKQRLVPNWERRMSSM